MKKVLLVASSGGHLEEISRLKEIENKYECTLITEKNDFKLKDFCPNRYYVSQINRKQPFFLSRFLVLFMKAAHYMRKIRPDFIITTGALVAYPFCVIGRFAGVKIVYIESFARVQKPSLTGRLLYNFSDLFIVQWEDMLLNYPKSVLGGGIF